MDETRGFLTMVFLCVLVVLGSVGGCMRYMPEYNVWQQEMEGKAALAKADQDREIRVREARAKADAAKNEAEAEVARARGSAEANRILLESLNSPAAAHYLQLRYIMMLEEHKNVNREVIYIPNSAPLPISEAGRAVGRDVNVTVEAPKKDK